MTSPNASYQFICRYQTGCDFNSASNESMQNFKTFPAEMEKMSTRSRTTQKGRKKMEVPVPSTSSGSSGSSTQQRQIVVRRTPYRLAVKKASTLSTENNIDLTPNVIAQMNPALLEAQLRRINKNETTPSTRSARQFSGKYITGTASVSFKSPENPLMGALSPQPSDGKQILPGNMGGQANRAARLLAAAMKIKPVLLLLLSTVLATPVFMGMGLNNFSSDGTDSEVFDRYTKFSHAMLDLQKEYIHQSSWFWHSLRTTGWLALTEPLHTMPMALLMVIPYGQEHVGYCLATKIVNSFNKVHGQKTTEQVTCSNSSVGRNENETALNDKRLNLAIRRTRLARQSAVLVDHLEKLANSSLPTLDKFLDPDDNAENKFLVFTFYVTSAHCNPEYVRRFMIDAWISKVFARPTVARKLMDNSVFITPYDVGVKCK